MHRSLRRDWRDLGRPQGTRLHRDAAPCHGVGAQRYAVLAGTAWRRGEFERRTDALADRERTVLVQPSRSARAGGSGMGCRAVPGAWVTARSLEHRS